LILFFFPRGEKYAERLVEPQPLRFSEGQLNLHKLSELPFHQTLAATSIQGDVLRTTLFDFEFIETKAEAGMWEQLDEDFMLAVTHLADPRASEFKRWFDQVKGNLKLFPNQALQSALHWPEQTFVWKKADLQKKEKSIHSYKVYTVSDFNRV
jgi:hypothetical protein